MKIVFFGTADFGIPALQRMREIGHTVAAVVTTAARPQGRGLVLKQSPIAQAAAEMGISPVYTPEDLAGPEFVAALKAIHADLFVVIAFRLLPAVVFTLPRLGTFNVHGSLLPAFRGPAPIHRAIQAGESISGVTVFKIDEGVDTGNVVIRKSCSIGPHETTPQVYDRLSLLGADALEESLSLIESGHLPLEKQDERRASRAPKLRKEEGLLDWSLSASELYNRIRAFKPFPGTYTLYKGARLGVEEGEAQSDAAAQPGMVVAVDNKGMRVSCASGSLLIQRVRPQGRSSMEAAAFARGAHLSVGAQLG